MVNFNSATNKVPLYELFDFTPQDISEILELIGLTDRKTSYSVERLDKYIFLFGDDQEVYKQEEREFIESVGNIYIYREFYKNTKRGIMPCRIIATEIDTMDEIRSSVFFMKEINKAISGFTLFFIKANQQFFVGMRIFNKDIKDDCILSKPMMIFEDFEEMEENLSYVSSSDDFIDYYSSLIFCIENVENSYEDYDAKVIRKRGIQYEYLQMLNDIGEIYGLNFDGEISRYYNSFDVQPEYDYIMKFKDICLELNFIESFKANTMEMLFEAEEIVQLATKTEEEQNLFIAEHQEEETEVKDFEDMREYLNDPEMMIKLLKQRKGI